MGLRKRTPAVKRYWYFVTQVDFSKDTTLMPRCPYSMADGEPYIKRICVAPTVAHCLSAIGAYGSVNVYRTKRRVNGYKCWNVPDSKLTNEHWLFDPTKFEFVTQLKSDPFLYHMTERGHAKDTPGYDGQRREKRSIVRNLSRIDPRLAVLRLSDQRWFPEGGRKDPLALEED